MKIQIQVYDDDDDIPMGETDVYSYEELKEIVDSFKEVKVNQEKYSNIDNAIEYISEYEKPYYDITYGGNELSCFGQNKDESLLFLKDLKDF